MGLDELVLQGIIRTAATTGARVEVSNTGWDYYGADGLLVLHIDPPRWEDTPWLCSGCEMCDGEKLI